MAFVTISSAQVATGQPVTADLMAAIKGDFDDHDLRITSLESSVLNPEPLTFQIEGNAAPFIAVTGVAYMRVWGSITLTGGFLWVIDAGSAGTMDVDVQLSHSGGSFATIFSARPTVAFGAGNFAISSNGVLSTTALVAGDVLRLDINTVQASNKRAVLTLPFHLT